jgi:hypothetical protein
LKLVSWRQQNANTHGKELIKFTPLYFCEPWKVLWVPTFSCDDQTTATKKRTKNSFRCLIYVDSKDILVFSYWLTKIFQHLPRLCYVVVSTKVYEAFLNFESQGIPCSINFPWFNVSKFVIWSTKQRNKKIKERTKNLREQNY